MYVLLNFKVVPSREFKVPTLNSLLGLFINNQNIKSASSNGIIIERSLY